MKIFPILILTVLSGFQFSHPATIKGTVTDTLTTAPIDSALVQVKGTSIQTYTDSLGEFTINTSAGVLRQTPSPIFSLPKFSGASAAVYGADGSLLFKKDRAANPASLLSGMPDGVYLVKARQDGKNYSARLLKMDHYCGAIGGNTGPAMAPLDKSGAAVTLVYSRRYYTAAEAVANEGDTGVAMKLRMWWPDSTTTGVPAGNALTVYAGGTITDGAIIQNKDITNTLDFSASNVTIRNCKIHLSSGYFGILLRSGSGLLVEDCEIFSTNDSGLYTAIAGSNMTVRRCHIHGWENGLSVGSNVTVEDCYIHDPCTYFGAHVDGMEWGGSGNNSMVRHNHIIIRDETGCVNITPWGGGTADNNTVRNNLFYGGTYSLYMRGDGGGIVSSVAVIGNVWVKGSYVYGTQSVVAVTNITWKYNCLSDGTPVLLQ
jgi:hypothetical protein